MDDNDSLKAFGFLLACSRHPNDESSCLACARRTHFGQQETDSWPDEKEFVLKPTLAQRAQGKDAEEMNGTNDDKKKLSSFQIKET